MPVESAFDRIALLADFGVDSVYTPEKGASKTVKVIFDRDFQEADAGGSVAFVLEFPRVVGRTSELADAAEGETLSIEGVTYHIMVVMHDGQGMTELRLEKQ